MNASVKEHAGYGAFGLLMGVILSYTGFSDFEQVHNMFTLTDFRLLLAFGASIGLSMVGFYLLSHHTQIAKKSFNKGTVPGSILFGTGWALSGACPSIALVQLGEGQLAAVFSLLGILFGVWVYRRIAVGALQFETKVCGEE